MIYLAAGRIDRGNKLKWGGSAFILKNREGSDRSFNFNLDVQHKQEAYIISKQ